MASADPIAASIREVFETVPAIVGFAFDAEMLAEVEAQITSLALELIAEDPRGAEALRGRTFARSLQ